MFRWFSKKSKLPVVRIQILKNHAEKHKIPISDFEQWDIALTHISCGCDERSQYISYERLEFLGDSVLGLCLASILYEEYENLSEGRMSILKSNLADEKTLAEIGRDLGLLDIIKLGRGERLGDNRAQTKVLCDIFESTLGVIFLEKGFLKSREFICQLFKDRIHQAMEEGIKDYKTFLQKLAVKVYKEYPIYQIVDTEGPDHNKIFTVKGEIGIFTAKGKGRSKKEAEQNAASCILNQISEHVQENPESCIAHVLCECK